MMRLDSVSCGVFKFQSKVDSEGVFPSVSRFHYFRFEATEMSEQAIEHHI